MSAVRSRHRPPASPFGRYSVVGSNPGGRSRYSGTVTVERTGDTFRVTWDIGSPTFVGTALAATGALLSPYRSGAQTGLAIYGAKGDNWEGVLTTPVARPSAAKLGRADNGRQ